MKRKKLRESKRRWRITTTMTLILKSKINGCRCLCFTPSGSYFLSYTRHFMNEGTKKKYYIRFSYIILSATAGIHQRISSIYMNIKGNSTKQKEVHCIWLPFVQMNFVCFSFLFSFFFISFFVPKLFFSTLTKSQETRKTFRCRAFEWSSTA